ncbi:MAG: NlpC/P60 family protein [Armatimonadota bacterium]
MAFANVTHTIKQGDTLWDIAKKYKTTTEKIAKANGINENATLKLGSKIKIPVKVKRQTSSRPTVQKTTTPKTINTPDDFSSAGKMVHVKSDGVWLRSGAGTNFGKIALMPQGATAKVISARGKWTKVAFGDGTTGFIYSDLLNDGEGSVVYNDNNRVERIKGSSSESDSKTQALIEAALACRGDRYRMGGTSRGGFDCSGFTRYIFAKYGINLPHNSAAQFNRGTPVAKSDLKPGDLVFFRTRGLRIGHVGMYIGDNKFIHAATYGKGVRIDSINDSYYGPRYQGARRVK